MGHFNKFGNGNRGGGGGGFRDKKFGGGNKFGGHGGAPRQMYSAICSNCGQSCEVPFAPTGDRPVFCNNCFKSQRGENPGRSFAPKSFGGGNMGARTGGGVSAEQINTLNSKLDKILSLLSASKAGDASQEAVSLVKAKKEVIKKVKSAAKKAKGKKK